MSRYKLAVQGLEGSQAISGLLHQCIANELFRTYLGTSPANWKVTAIDDECLELIDLTVQPPFPYMVNHLEAFTGPNFTTKLRVRKAAIAVIEFVIDYPTNTT